VGSLRLLRLAEAASVPLGRVGVGVDCHLSCREGCRCRRAATDSIGTMIGIGGAHGKHNLGGSLKSWNGHDLWGVEGDGPRGEQWRWWRGLEEIRGRPGQPNFLGAPERSDD